VNLIDSAAKDCDVLLDDQALANITVI